MTGVCVAVFTDFSLLPAYDRNVHMKFLVWFIIPFFLNHSILVCLSPECSVTQSINTWGSSPVSVVESNSVTVLLCAKPSIRLYFYYHYLLILLSKFNWLLDNLATGCCHLVSRDIPDSLLVFFTLFSGAGCLDVPIEALPIALKVSRSFKAFLMFCSLVLHLQQIYFKYPSFSSTVMLSKEWILRGHLFSKPLVVNKLVAFTATVLFLQIRQILVFLAAIFYCWKQLYSMLQLYGDA